MNKLYAKAILVASLTFGGSAFGQTITSISNGNFLNPLTWDCTCIPLPGSNVTVAHAVNLDTDMAFASGSLTVSASGSLMETAPRAFAMSGGAFTNNGSASISTIAVYAGTFENHGDLQIDSVIALTTDMLNTGSIYDVDSFWTSANIQNQAGAEIITDAIAWTGGTVTNAGTIEANALWNDGILNNSGSILISDDMANTGDATNSGTINIAVDFWNGSDMNNTATGIIEVGADCVHGDSLGSVVTWTNDGFVYIGEDFANVDNMDGSGRWCVEDSTYNTGTMTGTFDFCDLTGSNVDFNTGTIAGTITNCTSPCNVGISELNLAQIQSIAYPNPFENQTIIQLNTGDFNSWENLTVELFDQTGKLVQVNWNVQGNEITIDGSALNAGMYMYLIKDAGTQQSSGIVIAR